ncbi:uncharacterized protein EAE98_010233 [Botrytis deweyae]|uniref:Uncharacterized protein n=1 Tax=Botrytis deweyae TaxID=2478750 RepID=A0ABQ7I9U6_9HELO|nr:uncharacterized protein EAE98_010233 [Botrytis deweyae]KAF7917470.1 hypothetical protein EAE98_010233 [Botrytis deweyae]KAF7920415.1 hypothetical protein EAE99_008029 [Botrytis elliptica]
MESSHPFNDLLNSPFARNWSPFYVKFRGKRLPIIYHVENKRVSTKNTFFNDLGLHCTHDEPYVLDDCFQIPLQLFLRWLQEDQMDTILSEAKREHKPLFNETWAIVVVHLCLLCECWEFPVAFNAAMDHLIHLRDFSFMMPHQIEAIYKATCAGSGLRRLIGDLLSIGKYQEQMEHLGLLQREIVGEVFEELLDNMITRELPETSLFDDAGNVRNGQLAEYHMKL